MSIAIIGGSGVQRWALAGADETLEVSTPYAPEPVRLRSGKWGGQDVVFLPRHGPGHTVPPHRINYRANIHALKTLDVTAVLAMATVGGISAAATPGSLMVPDQILDYTYDRAHTFFDGEDGHVAHVDMSEPYCEGLRRHLIAAGSEGGVSVIETGTYAATQGPRFETPAEIRRLERDGADVVGMTGMPEAALARELQLAYAALAVIVNPAAGKATDAIDMAQIQEWLLIGSSMAEDLLERAVGRIGGKTFEVPPPVEP